MSAGSDNRLTMVPAIGLYAATANESRMVGKVGVTASNITCAPLVGPGDRSLGEWSATDSELHAVSDQADRGPRSGVESEYESACLAVGRHRMLLTETALLGAVEGRTAWGDSGGKKAGRLLVWKWDLADIHEIRVWRLKKAFKLWDVRLTISCSDPEARLDYSGLGDAAAPFRAIDKTAKAASVDGSELLGLANSVAAAATAGGGRVERTERQDGKDYLYVFRFSPAANGTAVDGLASPADDRASVGSVPREADEAATGEGGGPHSSDGPATRPEKVPTTPGSPEPAPTRSSAGFCTQCGTPLYEESYFCSACGASTTGEPPADTSTPPAQLPAPPPGPDSSPPLKGVRSTPRPPPPGLPAVGARPPTGLSAWLGIIALVAGALVVAGTFLPFVSSSGSSGALIDGDWTATAVLTVGALMVVGGIAGLVARWGTMLAAGAGVTFLGISVLDLSSAVRAVDAANDFGGDLSLAAGFAAWAAAVVLCGVLAVVALTMLGSASHPTWPYAVGSAGAALLAIGVLSPPDGFSFGELAFAGDSWSDASMGVLLGGLATAALVLALVRSPNSAVFALAVVTPWAASWLVFAVEGTFGGLPVPFPETPALTGLAVAMVSMTWVGALWAPAGATVATGAPGLAFGQVMTIVVCGASVLAAAGGVAAANGSESPFASSPSSVSPYSGADGVIPDPGAYDVEDESDVTGDTFDASSSGQSSSAGDTFETEECIEIECEDGSGDVTGYDDDVLTNVACPSGIAADIRAAGQGSDAGYLQARYEAGNFVIHVCTGPGGSVYHGQNVTNTDMIVLPASGDVYSGFVAVNGSYTYSIDDSYLVIEVSGELLQEDPVFAYDEY